MPTYFMDIFNRIRPQKIIQFYEQPTSLSNVSFKAQCDLDSNLTLCQKCESLILTTWKNTSIHLEILSLRRTATLGAGLQAGHVLFEGLRLQVPEPRRCEQLAPSTAAHPQWTPKVPRGKLLKSPLPLAKNSGVLDFADSFSNLQ